MKKTIIYLFISSDRCYGTVVIADYDFYFFMLFALQTWYKKIEFFVYTAVATAAAVEVK